MCIRYIVAANSVRIRPTGVWALFACFAWCALISPFAQTPCGAQRVWRRYQLSGFAVSTPWRSRIVPRNGQLAGHKIPSELLICQTWSGRLIAFETPLPNSGEDSPGVRAERFARNVVHACGARVVRTTPASINGYTGATYIADSNDGKLRDRFFIAANGGNIFVVGVQSLKRRDNGRLADRYFHSIEPGGVSEHTSRTTVKPLRRALRHVWRRHRSRRRSHYPRRRRWLRRNLVRRNNRAHARRRRLGR